MGNRNSTRWNLHSKKKTVENSLKLDLKDVYSALIPGVHGVLSWKRHSQVHSKAIFSVRGYQEIPSHICLEYGIQGDSRNYEIELTTTPLPWGGVRYWFRCPNIVCRKRSRVLYCPAGGNGYFYCRQCHNLTYTSSQESGQSGSLFKTMASQLQGKYPGIAGKDVRALLNTESRRRQKLKKSKKYARLLQILGKTNKHK